MSFLSILATIVGVMMALAGLPQAIKISKRKSVEDISPVTYFIIGIGGIVWVLYGLEIKSFAVVISNGLGVLTSAFVVLEYFLFRKSGKLTKEEN
jgi:MtN3 and saliva related transmembrane protein